MKKQLSIITSAILLSTSTVYADSYSVEEAFKNGQVSGDISAHYQKTDKTDEKDSGFSAATIGLNYKTDSINGFALEAGFRANHQLTEEENGDYEGEFKNNSLMTLANISYSNEMITVIAGRQEIDLEWIGDYNEAIVAALTPSENITMVAAYSTRQAASGVDESGDFEDITDDGAYVLDAKYEALEGLVINPYFYSAKDAVDFYGLKTDFDSDMFGLTAHYAKSSTDKILKDEDGNHIEDGSVKHFEARTSLVGVDLALGYINTNKKGIGAMDSFGDNIDPTEELGAYDYEDTYYGAIAYTIADVELSALYAQGEKTSIKDKEITLGAGYSFTDNLSAEILYTDLSLESNKDYSKLAATVSYAF